MRPDLRRHLRQIDQQQLQGIHELTKLPVGQPRSTRRLLQVTGHRLRGQSGKGAWAHRLEELLDPAHVQAAKLLGHATVREEIHHALLRFYNLRLGVPEALQVDTRSRHETAILRDDDRSPQALTRERQTLFLDDRAFIDARFWDAKKTKCASPACRRTCASIPRRTSGSLPIPSTRTSCATCA